MSNNANITLMIANRKVERLIIAELQLRGIFRPLLTTSYSFAIIFHVIGFIALYYYKKRTNQNIIMFFLSVVEIGLAITGLLLVQNFHMKFLSPFPHLVVLTIHEILVFELIFSMYILTMDRMICAIDPLKYKSRMTKINLIIYFAVSWLISLVLILLRNAFSISYQKALVLLAIIICAVYIALAFTTYLLIVITVKKSRNRVSSESTPRTKSIKKQYMIPMLIISTFLTFYLIPFGIARTTPQNTTGILSIIIYFSI